MKTKTKPKMNKPVKPQSVAAATQSGVVRSVGSRRGGRVCVFLLIVIAAATACTQPASNVKELKGAFGQPGQIDDPEPEFPAERDGVRTQMPTTPGAPERSDEVSLGSGTFTGSNPASRVSRPTATEDTVVLNFQGADIQAVVKAILGEMLGENYVIEQGVSGTVTTESSGGLAKADLLPVLETLLRQSQAALIKEGDLYRIVPIATSIKAGVRPTVGNRRIDPSYGMQVISLRYIAVSEMQKILEPILTDGAMVHANEKRNLLILAGTPTELQGYLDTIAIFDVDWMSGMSLGLFALDFVAPDILIKELEQALGDGSGQILDGLVRLIALERLGSLLAISPSRQALLEIRAWVDRLDVPSDTADPKLYVFRLQNAKAIEVAAILNDIFSSSDLTPLADRDVELAPGLSPIRVGAPENSDTPGEPAARSLPGTGVALRVGEKVRVIPDETNNALVILATPREYEILTAAIRQLDLIPLQVLIEAAIIEVTLSDALEYGVEWFFKNNLPENKQGQGLLDLGAAGIGTLAPGFSYAVVDTAGQVRAVINALAQQSRISVLSSPSLMVLDNQTAFINVGDEIPIPTRSAVSTIDPDAPIVNDIEYRNTGVTLQVTPRVNAGGLVTMEVDQEVSDAVNTTSSDLDAPTIQQRKITSTVAVQSGDTIVLGGLIRDRAIDGESGVPYLRNIPVVGKLFGQSNNTTSRAELIVLITPRAVTNDEDARAVTEEYSEKLKSLDPPRGAFEIRY